MACCCGAVIAGLIIYVSGNSLNFLHNFIRNSFGSSFKCIVGFWGFGVLGFWDFGGMKRAKGKIDGMSPKEWFDFMFDHTLIVAEDDPYAKAFAQMHDAGVAQVRFIPATGAEKFAEYIYNKVNEFIFPETNGRVQVVKVEFREHEKNNAIYIP